MAAAASVLAGRGAKCPAMGRGARRRHRGWPGALPGLGSEPAVSSTNMSEQLKSLVKAGDRLLAPHRIGGCRRELLDRTLIWNQAHLRQILRRYGTHDNQHRPHRSLDGAAPLTPLPEPVDLEQYRVPKYARAGATINEYRLIGVCQVFTVPLVAWHG